MVKSEEGPAENPGEYQVRLLFRSSQQSLASLSILLGLKPSQFWEVGDRRKTPRGRILDGNYSYSLWGYSGPVKCGRYFSSDVRNMIALLSPHRRFLREIADSGGYVGIIVNLSGENNIGDQLEWMDLVALGRLKLSFGIEVFPSL